MLMGRTQANASCRFHRPPLPIWAPEALDHLPRLHTRLPGNIPRVNARRVSATVFVIAESATGQELPNPSQSASSRTETPQSSGAYFSSFSARIPLPDVFPHICRRIRNGRALSIHRGSAQRAPALFRDGIPPRTQLHHHLCPPERLMGTIAQENGSSPSRTRPEFRRARFLSG